MSYSPWGRLASDATEATQNRCTEERCSAGKGRDDVPPAVAPAVASASVHPSVLQK